MIITTIILKPNIELAFNIVFLFQGYLMIVTVPGE